MYYINMYYNLSFIQELHVTYLIPLLKMFPYNSNWIFHLNKCFKKLFNFTYSIFFLLLLSLQIFTSIEGVSLQKQQKMKNKHK